jgi:hypothetical protein
VEVFEPASTWAPLVSKRKREEERKRGGSERHYIWVGGVRNYISSFEGSQAVPARPSGREI